jgi:CheY-like chemotaxis protein
MANILLVDDQPYMQYFLSEELAEMGHSFKWIGTGDALLLEFEERHPDMVLLDLFIDGFEGWALFDRIKRYDPQIPVIILTAYDNFSDDPKLSRAQGYVIKNIDPSELRRKITQVLASSSSTPSSSPALGRGEA